MSVSSSSLRCSAPLLFLSVIFVRPCSSSPLTDLHRLRLRHLRSLSCLLCIFEKTGDENAGGVASALAPSYSPFLLTCSPILLSLASALSSL
ncbi:hypothetical protein Scep_014548 [Stephania cephalantha]|uniref:Secreted protein n=1 Tax=Stephania cephalantha TaxID=152367 RepID=A0AAP0J3I9_9MAGN